MYFKDVVGQDKTKNELIHQVHNNRIPHTQLFKSKEGVGAYSLALAYATFINCEQPTKTDSCGNCPSCLKMKKLVHPDLHFTYPTIKQLLSKDYVKEWRDFVLNTPYFSLDQWLDFINAQNAQAIIYQKDSKEIIKDLSFKPIEGKYKISLIWLPERMHLTGANRLLKLLEEPPLNTLFLLISEQPEKILPTILSRAQEIHIPSLTEEEIASFLEVNYALDTTISKKIAHSSNGNLNKALQTIQLNENKAVFLKSFVEVMRLAYMRKVKDIKLWSEAIAKLGRERQKQFLSYCQYMIRENFIYNINRADLNFLNSEEEQFSKNFAPFINERNIIQIMNELDLAQQHIGQNANAKIVLFDMALKFIVLIKQ